jgi:two-component system, cell cycle response regulator DivK
MAYILLVEDDVQSANVIVRLLSAFGFEVRHVSRGLKAAQLARLECPSLILMDFDLPDVTGLTVTMIIRKQLGENAPPIVAVTAHSEYSYRKAARQAGCAAFVAKPFSPRELLDIVNSFLIPASAVLDQLG